ncbi:hypothetical protein [Kitasatospora griseola]
MIHSWKALRELITPAIMVTMNPPNDDWVTIAGYENLPGCPHPMAATRA